MSELLKPKKYQICCVRLCIIFSQWQWIINSNFYLIKKKKKNNKDHTQRFGTSHRFFTFFFFDNILFFFIVVLWKNCKGEGTKCDKSFHHIHLQPKRMPASTSRTFVIRHQKRKKTRGTDSGGAGEYERASKWKRIIFHNIFDETYFQVESFKQSTRRRRLSVSKRYGWYHLCLCWLARSCRTVPCLGCALVWTCVYAAASTHIFHRRIRNA